MKKEGKYISIKTLVMSTVLIMAVGTALFLTVEADSPDWDVNDDGYCNLLDVNQVAYYVGSSNPDYDVNNDGVVNQYDIQLVESHCDWQSGFPSGSGSFANTLVYVDPAYTAVAAGQSFSVDIYCEPGEPIRGFQFDLNFDETKLQANSVTNVGDIWSAYTVFSNPGTIDNVNGKITYVYATIQSNVETDVEGIFATITFTASTTSIGSSSLDLDNVKVTNLNNYVSTVVTDGTAEVFKNVQNTDTSEWFLTIQAAIDDSDTDNGDTIVASAGTYDEAVTIDKELTLLGATSGDCKTSFALPATLGAYDDTVQSVIKAPAGDLDAVTIEVSNVVFKGFVVEALDRAGSGGSNCNLINLRPPGSTPAIMTGIVIENNVIGPNTDDPVTGKGRHGLRFTAGYGHTISADVTCNMIYGTYGNGNNVFVWGTAFGMTGVPPIGPGPAVLSGTNIHNNNICYSARSGIELSGAQTGLTIENNDIHDNGAGHIGDDGALKYGLGIALVRDYTALQYGTYSPLGAAAGCVDGVTITDNEIYDNDKNGIYMGPMNKNHVITGNNIYNNGNSVRGSGSTFGPGDGIRIDLNGDYYPGWPQTAQYGSTSNIAAHDNNIYNNVGYGAQVLGIPTNGFILDAECNWWGSANGPTHSSNTYNVGSQGEEVSDYVDFCGWLDGSYPGGTCWGPVKNLATSNYYSNINSAITSASTGDTIELAAGVFSEGPQIHLTDKLTIDGQGCGSTIIKPTADTATSGDARGWFLVDDGVEFHLSDVKLDGSGYKIYQAIRHKGFGTIDHVCFDEIKYDESGPTYGGVAIAAFGSSGSVNTLGCTFEEIGRVGILQWISGTISGNTYTGKDTGNWLDYFVDTQGAVVTIDNNDMTKCTGVASVDGSTSAGILVTTLNVNGADVTITNNDIFGCTTGIAVGYDSSDTSTVVANYNNIVGNDYGVDSTAPLVDATCNWWGNAYGPLATDNVDYSTPTGKIGDSVSDNVDYTGWYWNDKTTCNGIPEYDINMDNVINIVDINAVAAIFGSTCIPNGGIREDVSDDGIIDILDLQMVAYYFNDGGWE